MVELGTMMEKRDYLTHVLMLHVLREIPLGIDNAPGSKKLHNFPIAPNLSHTYPLILTISFGGAKDLFILCSSFLEPLI